LIYIIISKSKKYYIISLKSIYFIIKLSRIDSNKNENENDNEIKGIYEIFIN